MNPDIYIGGLNEPMNGDDSADNSKFIQFNDDNLDGQLAGEPVGSRRLSSDDGNQLDEPILDTLMRDLYGIYNKMKIITLPLSSYDIYKVVLRGWDLWGPLLLCTFLAFNLHHSQDDLDKHSGPQFSDVFVLVWFGSCIVSLNYRLLSASSVNNQLISRQILQVTEISVSKADTGTSDHSNQSIPQQQKPETMIDQSLEGRLGATGLDQSGARSISSRDPQPHQTLVSPPSIFQLMCVFGYCLVAPCFGLMLLKIFSFSRLFLERVIIGLVFGFAWPTFCSVRILIRYQHPNKRALAIYPIGLFYFVLSCMIIMNH